MPIPTITYLDEQGVLSPTYKPLSSETLTNDMLLQGYRMMMLTRHVDDRMITLQRQGIITFAMSSLGEEACAIASAAALSKDDWMYPQYREAGIMFWRGFTVQQYVHHMFGNGEDPSFGRQMPNHFGSRSINVVTVSSPIGTKIPHAAGCAYGMKLQKEKAVTICYFGEGATSEGDFHAGLNFAAVRKVPAIFFCRNNGYAISTPCSRQYACEGVAAKGSGYGVTSFRVDGNDFFAVYDVVAKARELCLAGEGPVLIEAMTYRMGAHSTSDDPSQYRNDAEVEKWKEKCPVLRLKRYLEKHNLWDDAKEKQFVADITNEVTQAITVAKETARPSLKNIVEHVYFAVPQALQEEYHELKSFFPEGT